MGAALRVPRRGWLGLLLVAVFWSLNWGLQGPRTHWGFFPLWLGYCLVVDAWVATRKGHSLWTRSPMRYGILFLISIPSWWLFELLNRRTQNWSYSGAEHFSDLEYGLLASLSFSTVMPAVFGTAELVGSFWGNGALAHGRRFDPSQRAVRGLFIAGWLMLLLLLKWPLIFFPFMWGAIYLILEPVNVWLGNRTLLQPLSRGDWRPLFSLWLGCLVCAFFWEFWNNYSYPKWIYHIPAVDFGRVFEMPILGYGGYLPFAMELFALYHLLSVLTGRRLTHDYVQLTDDSRPSGAASPTVGLGI